MGFLEEREEGEERAVLVGAVRGGFVALGGHLRQSRGAHLAVQDQACSFHVELRNFSDGHGHGDSLAVHRSGRVIAESEVSSDRIGRSLSTALVEPIARHIEAGKRSDDEIDSLAKRNFNLVGGTVGGTRSHSLQGLLGRILGV